MGAGENGAIEASESVGMGETIEGAECAILYAKLVPLFVSALAAFLMRLCAIVAPILCLGIVKPKIIEKLDTI